MARLNRLTAVTVCVNYGDFLVHTISNKDYFDEWIVVTCREDTSTRRLCEEHGVKVYISDQLGPWGDCFDSAYLKGPVINEVLETLPADTWVLLLDADLLLPQRFRERLETYELYPRAVYGMYGRRECDSWEEFAWRRPVEPWAENIGYCTRILGFFQLFRLDQPLNRYPNERPRQAMHDDLCFQYQFKPPLRRLLPIVGLHVGPPRVNWAGRASGAFGESALQVTARRVPEVIRNAARGQSLWVIGADESVPWAALAEKTDRLIAIDWYGLWSPIDAALVQADRLLLRTRLEERWRALHLTVVCLPAEVMTMEAELAEHPADAVFFAPELSSEMAAAFWKLLIRGRQRPPVLMGQFYGFPEWRSTALSVSVFFGVPDEVYSDGSWNLLEAGGLSVLEESDAATVGDAFVVVFAETPEHIAVLAQWMAEGTGVPAEKVAVFIRRDLNDGSIVTLAEMTGLKFYDLPPARKAAVEAIRADDLGLLARFPSRRMVFADLETATSAMVRTLVNTPEPFAAGATVNWVDCTRGTRRKAAAVLTEILGIEVAPADIDGFPADLGALVCPAGARALDLWDGLTQAADSSGAERPVFTGLAAACLLAGEQITSLEIAEPSLAETDSYPWQRPLIPVRAGSAIAVAAEISDDMPFWPVAEYLAPETKVIRLLPGCLESGEDRELSVVVSCGDATDNESMFKCFLPRAGSHAEGRDLIVLPALAQPFPGASLYPYAQFDGFDLIMEMIVPEDRRDLGPEDGKPSQSCPIFISSALLRLLADFQFPARGGWRKTILRIANRGGFRVKLRHSGAAGWHIPTPEK